MTINDSVFNRSRFELGCGRSIFACVILLFTGMHVRQVAADEKTPASADAAKTSQSLKLSKLEWSQIDELPARYNGRRTTWGSVAKVMLQQISGTASPLDEVFTTTWFLQTISRHEDASSRYVFAIPSKELLTKLDLSKRDRSPDGIQRVSFVELVKVERQLQQIVGVARTKPVPQRTDLDTAAIDLQTQMMASVKMQYAHLFPRESEASQIRSILQLSTKAHEWNVVRIVPSADAKNPWRTLLAAQSIDKVQRLQNEKDHQPNKFRDLLKGLLLAYRANDATKFKETLTAYRELVGELPKPAFDFSVPTGWTERGVPSPFTQKFHSDTLTWGTNVLSMIKPGKRGSLFINANHFPDNKLDEASAINGWRMNQGQLPLTSTEIAALKSTEKVSGLACKTIVIDTPKNWPRSEDGKRTRSVSYIVHHKAGSWVFSLFGPLKECRDHQDEFTKFISSIRIGSEAGVKSWLSIRPLNQPDQAVTGAKLIVGVASRDDWVWVFRMVGHTELVEANKSEVIEFVKSLQLNGGPIKASELELPKSWDIYPETKGFMIRTQNGQQLAEAELTPFTKTKQIDQLSIQSYLNFFQKRFGYKELDEKTVAALTSTIKTKTGQITVAELTTPDRKVAANKPPVNLGNGPKILANGAQEKAKGIHYLTPQGWNPIPAGSFAAVKFKAGKKNDVTISVTALGVGAGGDAALIMNVNRWRLQVGLPVQQGPKVIAGLKVIKIDGVVTHVTDLAGRTKKILGSITFHKNKAWFVKAIGPLDSVDDEYDRFEFFMKNLKFAD